MKAKELRNMDNDQLVHQIRDLKDELFNLRFRKTTGELENTARIGEVKRDLARGLSVARERDIDLDRELASH